MKNRNTEGNLQEASIIKVKGGKIGRERQEIKMKIVKNHLVLIERENIKKNHQVQESIIILGVIKRRIAIEK